MLREAPRLIGPLLKRDRLAIVTDETVAAHQLDPLLNALRAAAIRTDVLTLPAEKKPRTGMIWAARLSGCLRQK